jgi:hypothetical protein
MADSIARDQSSGGDDGQNANHDADQEQLQRLV